MGKSSGSAPAPPDPVRTAQAQGAINRETAMEQARLNRINEYTPFGLVRYEETGNPDVPYQRTTELRPWWNNLLNQQFSNQVGLAGMTGDAIGRIRPTLGTPFSMAGLPGAGAVPTVAGLPGSTAGPNLGAAPAAPDLGALWAGTAATPMPTADMAQRQRVEGALMDRLDPYLSREDEAMRTRLANTGIMPGSEAYSRAMDDRARARNDARLGVLASAGDEMARAYGMNLGARQQAVQEALGRYGAGLQGRAQGIDEILRGWGAGLTGRQQALAEQGQIFGLSQQARQQALQERILGRQQPLTEIATLLGQQSGVPAPQFGGTPQIGIAAPNLAGLTQSAYNAQLANWQREQQGRQAGLGAIGGLAGTILGAPQSSIIGGWFG